LSKNAARQVGGGAEREGVGAHADEELDAVCGRNAEGCRDGRGLSEESSPAVVFGEHRQGAAACAEPIGAEAPT
jgi:hypothetical protein